jgi:hypothetical protein
MTTVVLLETVGGAVVGRRLTVNIEGRAQVVTGLVEGTESGIAAPAVGGDRIDVEDPRAVAPYASGAGFVSGSAWLPLRHPPVGAA